MLHYHTFLYGKTLDFSLSIFNFIDIASLELRLFIFSINFFFLELPFQQLQLDGALYQIHLIKVVSAHSHS